MFHEDGYYSQLHNFPALKRPLHNFTDFSRFEFVMILRRSNDHFLMSTNFNFARNAKGVIVNSIMQITHD